MLWKYTANDVSYSLLVLTNLGEKMTDEEVDELLKAVDTSSGEINYTGTIFPISYVRTAYCLRISC